MDPSTGVRHYRRSMGFYPTAKNSREELEIYGKIYSRAIDYLRNERINSLNAKDYFHDIQQFSWKEASQLYSFSSSQKPLEKLLPTLEACQVYILSVILSLISEEAYGREQRTPRHQGEPRHRRVLQDDEENRKRSKPNLG